MPATRGISRWGGAAFILGSLFFLVNKLDEMSRLFLSSPMADVISGEDVLLITIGQALSIIGFLAYFRVYGPRARGLGKSSLVLFCSGGILVAVAHIAFVPLGRRPELPFDPFIFVILGLAAFLIGLILFGIANLRQQILSRLRWLPLTTGLVGFVGFFMFSGGNQITQSFLALRTLFALGLVGLGIILLLERSIRVEAATGHAQEQKLMVHEPLHSEANRNEHKKCSS